MPDVSSTAPAEVTTWVALDVHKHSIVAAILPASGGTPRLAQIETTERAIRRFARELGDPATIALCYEAGPAAMTCCGCSPGWASPATSSRPRLSRSRRARA